MNYQEKCHTSDCEALALGPGCVIAHPPTKDREGTRYCYRCSKEMATGAKFVGSGVRVIRSTRGLS